MKTSVIALLAVTLCGCFLSVPEPPLPEDREGPVTQVTTGRAGEDKDPEIAADGKRLFYASSLFGKGLDLFVKEIGSNATTRLTSMEGNERFPKINPILPRMLAFCSDQRGEWDVYVLTDYTDGRVQPRLVSRAGAQDIHPSWSPDGTALVYCSRTEPGGEWSLVVHDFVTKRTTRFENLDGLLPEWSPRGNTILFQRMRGRDRGYSTLWTVVYEKGSANSPTMIFASDDWAAINAAWSPDGSRVVFATVGKSPAGAGILDEPDDLWSVRADGSDAVRITTSPAPDGMPAWAPDGTIYFVSSRTGSDRIWSIRPLLP